MSDAEKKKRVLQRSPNFPMIDLPDAIAKARQVYQAERRSAVSRQAILRDLGFKSETGHAARVVSALLQYGLLEKAGDHLRLSDRGNSILNLSDGSADRRRAITEAAKRPNLFGELLGTYTEGLPSDHAIRDYLIGAKQFNPTSVDQFIKVFRSTVEFANLRPDGDAGEAGSPGTEDGMDGQVDDTSDGDGKGKAKPPIPPAQGEKELLRFNLSGDRTVRLIFGGPHPTQEEIDELADYLKVSRRTFPAMIDTSWGRLSEEAFKARARGYLATETKAGKSGGAAIEDLVSKHVDESAKALAGRLAIEVLGELLAVRERRA